MTIAERNVVSCDIERINWENQTQPRVKFSLVTQLKGICIMFVNSDDNQERNVVSCDVERILGRPYTTSGEFNLVRQLEGTSIAMAMNKKQ